MVGAPARLPGILAFGRRERSKLPRMRIGNQRPLVSPRERLGREGQVHHQYLEIGSVTERVEGRFGPVSLGIAVARRDRLG